MSRLSEKLQTGARVFTAEITPPKGPGIKKLVQHAQLLKPYVDAVNITDCQRALVKMSSLAACRVLIDNGLEPVYQLTCRDRNTIGLQADLLGAGALQIPNLLCLTGDPVKVGDSQHSKSVFEVEAIGLLELVSKLQEGRDGCGNKMNASTKFFIGAVVNPTVQGGQLARMEKKIKAGARFFQTQANYDIDDFKAFLSETKKYDAKILAGVLVLHSGEIAHYIHNNIPGIRLPSSVLERFKIDPENEDIGIDFAVETMRAVENVCDGFHLMTVRREELIPKVMERYGSGKKA